MNDDGLLDIAWRGYTCHNGASGHGTTDGDCYTIITDETGTNLLTQIYPGSTERDGRLDDMLLKFTGSGPYRIVSFKNYDPTYYHGTARVHIRSIDGTIMHTKTGLYNTGWQFGWADMDGDGIQDIVCSNGNTSTNTVFILDTLLNTKDSLITSPGFDVRAICDIDGDGVKEVIIANKDSATVVCLDNHLVEEWRWTDPTGGPLWTVIVSDNDNDGKVEVTVLTENRITVLEGTDSSTLVELNKKPQSYSLGIYPNPFNSSLSISYTIAKASDIFIDIYDLTGNMVTELVNEHQEAGYYSALWNGENIPSGIYFVRLKAGEQTITKRAILMK